MASEDKLGEPEPDPSQVNAANPPERGLTCTASNVVDSHCASNRHLQHRPTKEAGPTLSHLATWCLSIPRADMDNHQCLSRSDHPPAACLHTMPWAPSIL